MDSSQFLVQCPPEMHKETLPTDVSEISEKLRTLLYEELSYEESNQNIAT